MHVLVGFLIHIILFSVEITIDSAVLVPHKVVSFLKGTAQKKPAASGSRQNQGPADHHRDESKNLTYNIQPIQALTTCSSHHQRIVHQIIILQNNASCSN